ncbi:DUF222 domain-containing protein [Arthrobacter sp. zg-Y859]|uniref:DUF222 domain-containing protein n=1 Tax=Arthrobacter jinronghuae TaxID=2964609 RepID=A0ABT1NN63_9MICC|nr:DUF222 domain-containing protein [Arthrobacter jinronghuae]MCQ1949162.1 DUF222 domain-containing protein [Arthrobacter jinronghuae]UWX78049.1 DUF222 domain-containing protein [Arthrobacter jinronghuae]
MASEPLSELQQPADFSVATIGASLIQRAEALLGEVHELRDDAAEGWGLLGFQDAVDLAAAIEGISRITDYLKLIAAAAIDRQRTAQTRGEDGLREFRSTADFMRARLRISRTEARRRLALGSVVLPATTITGETRPPAYPRLAGACADAALAATDADVIAHALEEALPRMEPQALDAMEKQLTDIGSHQDHDFLVRTAKHWTALLDQDRPPTEEELVRFQGIFPGRRRNGLNHLHIYCTDEQHEALTTLINSASNPRVNGQDGANRGAPEPESRTEPGCATPPGAAQPDAAPSGAAPPCAAPSGAAPSSTAQQDDIQPEPHIPVAGASTPAAAGQGSPAHSEILDRLPRPTRPQLLLEGLLAAVRTALASGGLPASGGMRPQVMVTISHDALLLGLSHPTGGSGARNRRIRRARPAGQDAANGPDNRNTEMPHSPSPGIAAFSGPIDTRTVRRIACDADLIPVVLGSKGQVLDLGRAARLFPPHLRKALHARDRGCAFPGCTVPGPWTEAHHVTFWERGGDTSIGNGVLLCSFHHHLIHQGNWQVSMRAGIPWFLPPAYIDPERRPLRNTYFHPGFLASGGIPNGT